MAEPNPEQTRFSPGLIGFYLSVGFASLGGAVFGVGFFVARTTDWTLLTVGVAMMVAGLLGGIRFLRAARSE